jgi:hypothetical protein
MHYLSALALFAAAALLCFCVVASVAGTMTAILDDDRRAQAAGVAAATGGFAGAIAALAIISRLVML